MMDKEKLKISDSLLENERVGLLRLITDVYLCSRYIRSIRLPKT